MVKETTKSVQSALSPGAQDRPAVDVLQLLQHAPHATADDVATLTKALWHSDWNVCAVAAQALQKIGKPAECAIPVMIDRLKSFDENVRASIALPLAQFDPLPGAALNALIGLLNDRDFVITDEEVKRLLAAMPPSMTAVQVIDE